MKKILLGAAFLFATGITTAQTIHYSESFDAGLGNWTLVDADGDGHEWSTLALNGGGNTAASFSYDNATFTALTPDNWMISEAIDLSSVTGSAFLTWQALGGDQNYADENYSVYVATTNTVADFEAAGSVFTEVVGASGGQWLSRSVDLSAYVGGTVYVAFRHHNVTDQYVLLIDEITVETPVQSDLAVTSLTVDKTFIGDRIFTAEIANAGLDQVTSFDVEWSFDGGAMNTETVTSTLEYGDTYTYTFNIADVTEGSKAVHFAITTADDDASNNSSDGNIEFAPFIRQYVATDVHGNAFDLYESLSNGQAIVLDFMASWCGPCQSSTPELSKFIEDNGSGNGNVQALAISIEPTDNNAVVSALNWNGGYYEYPKFAYTDENNNQYYHYAVNHGLNTGAIPFFVMICPNKAEPQNSTIAQSDVGFGNGMFPAYYQPALDQCESADYLSIDNFENPTIDFSVYPNPATSDFNITFELERQNDVNITVVNTMGQVVATQNLSSVVGVQLTTIDASNLEAGMYIVKVSTKNGETTQRLSVQ